MEAEGLFTVSLAGGRELAAFLGFSAAKLGTHGLQLFLDGVGGETYVLSCPRVWQLFLWRGEFKSIHLRHHR